MAEQTEGEKPQFKTPMPHTPTTKILAVGTFAPGTALTVQLSLTQAQSRRASDQVVGQGRGPGAPPSNAQDEATSRCDQPFDRGST